MNSAAETIPRELADALEALGRERGGKVACLVLVRSSELLLIYPGRMRPGTMQTIEALIVDAILEQGPR